MLIFIKLTKNVKNNTKLILTFVMILFYNYSGIPVINPEGQYERAFRGKKSLF